MKKWREEIVESFRANGEKLGIIEKKHQELRSMLRYFK